jgi:hypothetical protein
MNAMALLLEYSVEADVSPAFAWRFQTDVANWNDPPAEFALDGPFEEGSCGTTLMPGQEPLRWRVAEVRPGKSFILEMQLDRATLTFEWRFDDLAEHRTKLTQRIVLAGDNAKAYAGQVEAGFGPNLPDGMRRIASEMASAEKNSSGCPLSVGLMPYHLTVLSPNRGLRADGLTSRSQVSIGRFPARWRVGGDKPVGSRTGAVFRRFRLTCFSPFPLGVPQ